MDPTTDTNKQVYPAILTVDRHQVEECPRGPMLTHWGDALGQQAQDRLKGSEKKRGWSVHSENVS